MRLIKSKKAKQEYLEELQYLAELVEYELALWRTADRESADQSPGPDLALAKYSREAARLVTLEINRLNTQLFGIRVRIVAPPKMPQKYRDSLKGKADV